MKCDWCGKEIRGNDVHDGILITPHHFCSKKCQAEYHANMDKASGNSSDEIDNSPGLLVIIWKVVKWVIIITIVWFVYDNYIKGDSSSSDSRTAENVPQSSNIIETRNSSSYSSQETTVNYDDIKQIAYLWSDYHNDRIISRLVSLYAPQTNYY